MAGIIDYSRKNGAAKPVNLSQLSRETETRDEALSENEETSGASESEGESQEEKAFSDPDLSETTSVHSFSSGSIHIQSTQPAPRANSDLPSLTTMINNSLKSPFATNQLASTLSPSSNGHVKSSLSLRLTPQDRHYLNRMLSNLQMHREFVALGDLGNLSGYGKPFLDRPNGPISSKKYSRSGKAIAAGWEDWTWDKPESPAVLGYLFYRFVLHFPALDEAPVKYWTDNIQPFWDSIAERQLSFTVERNEITKRRMLGMALTRIFGTYYGTTITAHGSASPSRPTATIMRRVDALCPGSMDTMWRTTVGGPIRYNALLSVIDKRGTSFVIIARVVVAKSQPEYLVLRSPDQLDAFIHSLQSNDPKDLLQLPPPPFVDVDSVSISILQQYLRAVTIALSAPPPSAPPPAAQQSPILAAARSLLEGFLLGKPERIGSNELDDLFSKAAIADDVLDKENAAWMKAGKRAKTLRSTYASYKQGLIHGNELENSFALLRKCSTTGELAEHYRDAEKWAQIFVAYGLHYVFVLAPTAKAILKGFKSIHGLMPYAAMKLGLTLVNPTLAIRTFMALLLGQPVGQQSLFQRFFTIIQGSGLRTARKEVARLRGVLDDKEVAEAVERFVGVSYPAKEKRKRNKIEGESYIVEMIREQGDPSIVARVANWETSDPARFQTLEALYGASLRQRDCQQVIGIGAEESGTAKLLKASISIYYDTIYKIANAANLSARLGDLQAFFDDLIKTSMSDKNEAADFILLVGRHHESMWFFLHELARAGPLMDPLKKWSASGLAMIREGVPEPESQTRRGSSRTQSRDSATRATVNYDELLQTVDSATQAEILKEVRGLALYTRYQKVWSDIYLRADLAAIENPTIRFDKSALYTNLIAQDPEILDYLASRSASTTTEEESPEASFHWAWYAADSNMNGDWRAAKAAEVALLASRKKGKKFLRKKKAEEGEKKVEGMGFATAKVPAPRIVATRGLLEGYRKIVERAFSSARANAIL